MINKTLKTILLSTSLLGFSELMVAMQPSRGRQPAGTRARSMTFRSPSASHAAAPKEFAHVPGYYYNRHDKPVGIKFHRNSSVSGITALGWSGYFTADASQKDIMRVLASDASLELINLSRPRIQGISLSHANVKQVICSNEAMLSLTIDCPQLTHLDLSGSVNLQDLKLICPQLRSINLTGCSAIPKEDIQAIADNCKNLETVILDNVEQIGLGTIARFLHHHHPGAPQPKPLTFVELPSNINQGDLHDLITYCNQTKIVSCITQEEHEDDSGVVPPKALQRKVTSHRLKNIKPTIYVPDRDISLDDIAEFLEDNVTLTFVCIADRTDDVITLMHDNIKGIDASNCRNLTRLTIDAPLEELNISGCIALEQLYMLDYSQLKTIDARGCNKDFHAWLKNELAQNECNEVVVITQDSSIDE